MADIFVKEDLKSLLKNKHVVFMGDSNVRAIYKDFICLSQKSALISDHILRQKMEPSCLGDKLTFCGKINASRDYREEREYTNGHHMIKFYFITKVYSEYVEYILKRLSVQKEPDVIIINSCLWDVNRWGPNGVIEYRKNLVLLMKKFNEILSKDCLVIWMTTMPVSTNLFGGFLVKQLDFLKFSIRFHIMEANNYARKVVVDHGYDVLDAHYYYRMQIHRRCKDGIHWISEAMRYATNLLLTHISLAWEVPLPHRYKEFVPRDVSEDLDDEIGNGLINEKESASKDTSNAVPKTMVPQGNVRNSKKWKQPKRKKKRGQVFQRRAAARPSIRKTPFAKPASVSNSSSNYLIPNPHTLSLSYEHSTNYALLCTPLAYSTQSIQHNQQFVNDVHPLGLYF